MGGAADLLFDPQTGGGLLAAVAPDRADMLIEELKAAGYRAASVGRLMDGPPVIRLVP